MHYSPHKQLLFCHVSRTGGTSLTQLLENTLPDFRPILDQHAPIEEARIVLGKHFDFLYKFAFIRNPWDRLVSWYSLLGQAPGQSKNKLETVIDPGSAYWKHFDAFLETWCAQKHLTKNRQYPALSQWHQLTDADGNLLVNDYGRFEHYKEDVNRLLSNIGIHYTNPLTLNTSKHAHYSCYYSDFGRELVGSYFSDDIREFNYQFEIQQVKP